jgi:hypothetical protein
MNWRENSLKFKNDKIRVENTNIMESNSDESMPDQSASNLKVISR